MFEKVVFDILHGIIWTIEIIGIAIIVFGTFYSVFKMFINNYKRLKEGKKNGAPVKLVLAKYLALGLEFLLASEILKTVTINREWSEVMILGSIIVLRAAMSLLISLELSYEEKKEMFIEKKNNRNSTKSL